MGLNLSRGEAIKYYRRRITQIIGKDCLFNYEKTEHKDFFQKRNGVL